MHEALGFTVLALCKIKHGGGRRDGSAGKRTHIQSLAPIQWLKTVKPVPRDLTPYSVLLRYQALTWCSKIYAGKILIHIRNK